MTIVNKQTSDSFMANSLLKTERPFVSPQFGQYIGHTAYTESKLLRQRNGYDSSKPTNNNP
jgi:hypothetical protein